MTMLRPSIKQTESQGDYLRAIIGKKTIRAPFSGHLGIRLVNLGQMLREGDPIVSLQSLDPVYVNFLLPQQQLGQIQTGLAVRVTSDALAGQVIEGRITAINAEVDAATRNIQVQGTVANPKKSLLPGMFVNVAVVLPERENVLVIPATAVLYAAYSDSVFIVEEKKNEKDGRSVKAVRQQFVKLGEKRGDFVSDCLRTQGRRHDREHGRVQAAKRSVRLRGQCPVSRFQTFAKTG